VYTEKLCALLKVQDVVCSPQLLRRCCKERSGRDKKDTWVGVPWSEAFSGALKPVSLLYCKKNCWQQLLTI